MRLVVSPRPEAVAVLAASRILSALLARPDLVLALPCGRTPGDLYARLVADGVGLGLDLGAARVLDLDEYAGLGPGDAGSFARALIDDLLDRPPFDRATRHLLDGAGDPEAVCAGREDFLRAVGGVDLMVLGIGADGHLAFNEPGASFGSRTRLVTLSESTRQASQASFRGPGEVPGEALTLGLANILEARQLLLLATGPAKAAALGRALSGPVDEDCPASILQLHPDATVLADEAAAAAIGSGRPVVVEEPHLTVIDEDDLQEPTRLVVVSPHPDDASISCGGLVSLLGPRRSVTVLGFTTGHRATIPGTTTRTDRIRIRRRELEEECRILGAELRRLDLSFYDAGYALNREDIGRVADILVELEPDWVFVPSPVDRHPAHRASALLTLEAVRRILEDGRRQSPVEVWHYEGPWYLFEPGEVNAVVRLPARAVATKRAAIAQHVSQMTRHRYDEASVALARYRAVTLPEGRLAGYGQKGIELGEAAEAFQRRILSRRPTSEAP